MWRLILVLMMSKSLIFAQTMKEALVCNKEFISARLYGEGIVVVASDEHNIPNLYYDKDGDRRALSHFTTPDIIQLYMAGDWALVLKEEDGTGSLQLHGFHIETGEHRILAGSGAQILKTSGNRAVVIVGDAIYRFDLDHSTREKVCAKGEYAQFLFDDHLQLQLKMKIEHSGTWLVERADGALWLEIDPESTFTSRLLQCNGSGAYLVDGRKSDCSRLIFKSFDGSEQDLGGDVKADIEDVLFVDGMPRAYSTYYTERKWHVIGREYEGIFEKIFQEIGTQFELVHIGQKGWILETSDPVKGSAFWRWNGSKMVKLYQGASHGAQMYPLVFQARDGSEIVAYYTLPKEFDRGGRTDHPIPLVVYPHGGPFHGQDKRYYSKFHQWLASCGYATLSVNFRLSSGYGKKHVNAGNGQWGKVAHTDVLDAVSACIDLGITERGKLAVMGGSYGGYEALASLVFSPDFYTCVIAICAPSHLKTVMDRVPHCWQLTCKALSDRVAFFSKPAFIMSMGGDPDTEEGAAYLESCSPSQYLDCIQKPLLLVHGRNDHIVCEQVSEQIYQKMKEKGLSVTYSLFPDEGHRLGKPSNKLVMFDLCEKFLADHLGGRYEPIDVSVYQQSSAIVNN